METNDRASAQERIREAFLQQLRGGVGDAHMMMLLPRIGKMLDAHFRTYCENYEETKDVILKNGMSAVALAAPKRLDKLSVTALTRAAGVNRTTFYKLYASTEALYESCCEALVSRYLAVPIPKEHSPENMQRYAGGIWALLRETEEELLLLSHRVARRGLPHTIGVRLQKQLASALTDEERGSFDVKKNLDVVPDLFSVWLGEMEFERIVPGLYPSPRRLPAYDPGRSLIENLALFFSRRYGGSTEVYYNFGLAALKLLSEKGFREVTVSEFCREAGYPRSAFYSRFSDITDYIMKVFESAVVVCISAFLFFLDDQEALTRENMEIFRGEMLSFKEKAVRDIFINGSISYLFSPMFTYMQRGLKARLERMLGRKPTAAENSRLSYYVAYAMRLFSLYYLGDLSAEELGIRRNELAHIRSRIWNET